jgi:D-lactate dehydrogenase
MNRGVDRSVLHQLLGPERCREDPATCLAYGYDNSRRTSQPEVVVFPETIEEICCIIEWAACNRVAVVPRGFGSNTTGASVPVTGGLVMSTERMTRILDFEPRDRLIVAQAGVTNEAIQKTATRERLFWPPDPSSASYSTVGGNIGTNAGGPHAVRYGTTRDNVLGLVAVDGQGRVFRTGVKTTKSAIGYDLTRLIVGSEGTLAIVAEATLKLVPRPAERLTYRTLYTSPEAATGSLIELLNQPIPPSAIEFMDQIAIDLIRDRVPGLPKGAQALLLTEIESDRPLETADRARLEGCLSQSGLLDLDVAESPEAATLLWMARKSLSPALRHLGSGKINEDIVVPTSRLPELLRGLARLGAEHETTIVTFGHAGNGNLHVNLIFDEQEAAATLRANQALESVFRLVLQLEGTLSGEHGIGLSKRPFMPWQVDESSLFLMRGIKKVFDPTGILNPGKLLPDPPDFPHLNPVK